LWAVRLFKTRSAANDACSSGRVRVGGSAAKPAHRLTVGDEVAVRTRGITRTYRVDRVIEKRVGAAIAAECYEDLTPPDAIPPPRTREQRIDAAWAERTSGSGRPTKRERRQIDKFLGRRKR
jgi:ribosome-associated heat shock protein Hsp15